MFKDMMNDTIRVVKKDGTRSEEIKALVTPDKIISFRVDVVIEAGDTIERYCSNGAVEKYVVIKPCFYEKNVEIDAHYQMRVRDLTASKDKKSPNSVTYNVQGDHNRIVSDSTDNSTNLNMRNSELQQSIEGLKRLLISSSLSDKERSEANNSIEELDNLVQTRSPKKVVMFALLEKLGKITAFASSVANIAKMIS